MRQLAWCVVLAVMACRPADVPQVANTADSAATDSQATSGAAEAAQPAPARETGSVVGGVSLTVAVLDDPAMAAAIGRRGGEWTARGGGIFHVVDVTAAAWAQEFKPEADIVVYPMEWVGEWSERGAIVPLRMRIMEASEYNEVDLFPLVRQMTRWGDQPMAVPLGMPVWVLLYRRDLLDAHGFEPPESWQDYHRLAERLRDGGVAGSVAGEGAAEAAAFHPVIEPLASPWAAHVLLARAAAYAVHAGQYPSLWSVTDGRPLIDAPPFVRALKELCEIPAVEAMPAFGPHSARRELLAGRAAMVWTWLTAADGDNDHTADWDEIGVAPLPGSRDFFDPLLGRWQRRSQDDDGRVPLVGIAGRLGSVTAASRNAPAALRLLAWLAGPELDAAIGSASRQTAPFRGNHTLRPEAWAEAAAAREYALVVEESLSRRTFLEAPRIPGAAAYLAALDAAVRRAVERREPAEESLGKAADAWREIALQSGEASHLRAIAHSVGL